jgi:glycosyltransferase involved in cell wall biosynthesis
VRLVALVESPDHVCCRYRLRAFRERLAAAGHTLDFAPLPESWFARAAVGRGLASADAVILQRKLLPAWVVARLRRRVPRLIFDFDDAVWLRDSYSPKGFDDPKRAARFRATVSACDLVVAGNEHLAAEARRWTNPDRVVVIPTCVDVAKYPLGSGLVASTSPPALRGRGRREAAGEGVETSTLGAAPAPSPGVEATPTSPPQSRGRGESNALQLVWVGSSSTLRGLERFTPTLSAIGRAVPGTRLKLVCDRFLDVPDLPVDRCVWDEATEARDVAAADVGIGWVPDDPWSRGKCGLKVLQYHAAGLPVVANPVGVQREFVRDAGFLATSTEEWVAAIRRLADPELRKRHGDAGRRRVEAAYSVEAGARRWVAALEKLAARKAG